MKKDELIKLIESLDMKEIIGLNISYYSKEKPYGNDDRELRNIGYNFNVERELNNVRRNLDMMCENLNRNMVYMIEEKIEERGNS